MNFLSLQCVQGLDGLYIDPESLPVLKQFSAIFSDFSSEDYLDHILCYAYDMPLLEELEIEDPRKFFEAAL